MNVELTFSWIPRDLITEQGHWNVYLSLAYFKLDIISMLALS